MDAAFVSVAVQTDSIKNREILSSWESLLHWSENASVARQLQDEMAALKGVLNKLGHRNGTFDSESSIQLSIEDLKNEKTQLHTHRSTMLRLNASVHSWLTRQEMKMAKANEREKLAATGDHSSGSNALTNITEINDGNTYQTANITTTTTSNANATSTVQVATVHQQSTAAQFDINHVDEELHKQLKNEVGDMYNAWDEANQRISNRLDGLTTSLIAWKQFESGLNEFKEALGKDKGALKGLTGALEMGNDVTNALADDVKEVAKRLSEQIENQQHYHQQQQQEQQQLLQQQLTGQHEHMHLNPIMAAFGIKSSSNGSLSDSGISDGGASSDYGLSERERRLSALRRLARQLENALAPGSAALHSISQRMEAAEADLRSLQDTCRQLIVRTAASQQSNQQQIHYHHQQQLQQQQEYNENAHNPAQLPHVSSSTVESIPPATINYSVPAINVKGKQKRSPQSKRKNRRRSNGSSITGPVVAVGTQLKRSPVAAASAIDAPTITTTAELQQGHRIGSPEPDPDDPSEEKLERKKWARRVAKYAIPIQMALVAIICAVCCLEPHCCDTLNNFSMSFTPQLRYIKGPPPI